jgi:excisionase family DNA binding protein
MDTVQADVTSKKSNSGPPLTITIKSAVELSGLSRVTINRLMWAGKLRSSKVGSRRLIEYASFVKALGLNQPEAA